MPRNPLNPRLSNRELSVRGVLGLLAVAALSTLAYAIASREKFSMREINNQIEETLDGNV